MPPARSPATPDVMALLCLIGGAVREAGSCNLLMQLLVIGTFCRPLGNALRVWMSVEDRYATTEEFYNAFAEGDGEGGCDEVRPGWRDRSGPVLLWRHVTRFGDALLIPIQWAWTPRAEPCPQPGVALNAASLLSPLPGLKFFVASIASAKNCALFVTI